MEKSITGIKYQNVHLTKKTAKSTFLRGEEKG